MNVKALQRSDRWVGIPLCFAFTAMRALFGRSMPDCSRPPRNLLVVKLAEQGSTVLAYQALQRAVEIVGRENVYFIAFEENRFILDALGIIPEQNVVVVSVKNLSRICLEYAFSHPAASPLKTRCVRRHGIFFTRFRSAVLSKRGETAYRLSCFFWSRAISRRSDDSPVALQSAPPHQSNFHDAGGSHSLRPRNAANIRRDATDGISRTAQVCACP